MGTGGEPPPLRPLVFCCNLWITNWYKKEKLDEDKFTVSYLISFDCIADVQYALLSFAQQNSQAEAIIAAERDAQNDVNGSLWFLGGCLGGVTGVIVAYAVEPTPPATRLLGKSPEYVTFYSDAYKTKAKKLQTNNALRGCVVGGLVVAGIYVVAIVAAIEGSNY